LLGSSKYDNKDLVIFRYNESSGIATLDPAFAKDQATIWATNQLFNGLVQLDKSLNVQPSIAKSWIISVDALHYTFSLRNDVYFHDDKIFENGNRHHFVN
jgi:peptide/nickel transport system substrate-binding protein